MSASFVSGTVKPDVDCFTVVFAIEKKILLVRLEARISSIRDNREVQEYFYPTGMRSVIQKARLDFRFVCFESTADEQIAF